MNANVRWSWPCRGRLWRRGLGVVVAATVLVVGACGTISGPASSSQVVTASRHKDVAPFTFAAVALWGSTWSFNNLNPDYPTNVLDDFGLVPLAIANPPRFGQYIPELATSWKTGASTVTIHLRRDAKWQNGSPVTSKDVLTTLLLEGTSGNALWDQIDGLSAPSTDTVVLQVKPGVPSATVLSDVLPIYTLPNSQFGRFVVPGLKQDLLSYFKQSATDPQQAASSPQGKAVAAVFKKVEAYQPKKFLGDGPFTLSKITTLQALLTKSPHFWAASKIHVPEMSFLNSTNNNSTYADLFSGKADYETSGFSYPIVERWQRTPDSGYVTPDSYQENALYFNDKEYPLNLLGVRKALAYVIDRSKPMALANSGPPAYRWVRHPDGLFYTLADEYLTTKQISSLNTYSYNPKRATSLLEGLHFRKVHGAWMTPKGQPFKMTLDAAVCCSITVAEMKAVAAALSSFGIASAVDVLSNATSGSDLLTGNFQAAVADIGGQLDPLAQFEETLVNYDYISGGANKGDTGIGFGPVMTVPGLGKVNVPQTLSLEEAKVGPGKEWHTLSWYWARLINQQVPFLPIADRYIQIVYSKARYTDWPAKSNKVWDVLGLNSYGALLVPMEQGYIRPK